MKCPVLFIIRINYLFRFIMNRSKVAGQLIKMIIFVTSANVTNKIFNIVNNKLFEFN